MKRNKIIKVSYMGRKQSSIDLHRTYWGRVWYKIKLWFRRMVALSALGGSVYGLLVLGGLLFPQIHFQTVEAIVEVERPAAIMQRIAGCESQGSAKLKGVHFDKNGQVLMRSNTNKSVDVGKYQINTVWFAKATELGLDITLEKDNEEMAMWIYKNRGTEDWYSSKACWK